jgi:hypothetical protein
VPIFVTADARQSDDTDDTVTSGSHRQLQRPRRSPASPPLSVKARMSPLQWGHALVWMGYQTGTVERGAQKPARCRIVLKRARASRGSAVILARQSSAASELGVVLELHGEVPRVAVIVELLEWIQHEYGLG